MSIKPSIRLVVLLVVITSLMAACATPTAPPAPTADQGAIATAVAAAQTQAAETVVAQITQEALLNPSPTPTTPPPTEVPTATPTVYVLPTATPTRVVVIATAVIPTLTPTPTAIGCKLQSQSPANGTTMDPGFDFDGKWTIKNTGTSTWDKSSIDFKYLSGTKFQKFYDVIDLPEAVASGDTVDLVIDMKAPSTSGTYTATWSLVGGTKGNWCQVGLTIKVK